ncbi:MAG: sigma factor-like helix-turn-helix DNA-binding protein [Candidatus Pacebacteria bacterium]|nr:sigma factor-like helix-turn-helix DNA-binding protein [Candidatus Paceibacterota bacterium]
MKKELKGGEKFSVDLKKLTFDMLKILSERQRNVIVKRYNLDGGGVQTLDKIGREYEITRERVRQIETESIGKLKENIGRFELDRVFDFVKKIIEENGGLIGEERLAHYLFVDETDKILNKQILVLVLDLDDAIQKSKEDPSHKKFYFYETSGVDTFEKTLEILEEYFKDSRKSIDFDSLVDLARESVKKEGVNEFSHNSIRSYLDVNKIILENILGEWGHHKWPHINPKSVKDKAYLTLKKENRPMHFTEITGKINDFWLSKKSTNSQTVHNELIKDGRFVLIGRGIYALKEWGYRPGVVLDVIIDIIKEQGGTMSQEDIVEEVMKKRQVKRNTVILNLQNKKYFEKLPNKIYRLK